MRRARSIVTGQRPGIVRDARERDVEEPEEDAADERQREHGAVDDGRVGVLLGRRERHDRNRHEGDHEPDQRDRAGPLAAQRARRHGDHGAGHRGDRCDDADQAARHADVEAADPEGDRDAGGDRPADVGAA